MKKQIILLCIVLVSFLSTNQTYSQSEPYLGNIVMFAGNFAPKGWAFCDGQLLSISQNQALFSLLGTTYGGDGRTTFGLPDLRGRAPMSPGNGPGLSPKAWGQKLGTQTETLNVVQLPSHNHSATSTTEIAISTDIGTVDTPNGHFLANHTGSFNEDANGAVLGGVSSSTITTIGNSGGSQSHNNMQPSIAIHYIIALQGIYPSRN